MPILGLQSKQFPTFRPDFEWETATYNSNNPFLFITRSPTATTPPPLPPHPHSLLLNSEAAPALASHMLSHNFPSLPLSHLPGDFMAIGRHEPEVPIDFCPFVKPETGVPEDDYTGFGFPVGNFGSRIGLGLNLGHRTYFSSHDTVMISKHHRKGKGSGGLQAGGVGMRAVQAPRCQAEGCKVDLSNAKHYHRRHKVCEFHSKAPKVVMGGIEQRFCQQCSRFHVLAEFDEVKRSCRKRLADHNRRRRKTHSAPVACGTNAEKCTPGKTEIGNGRRSFNDSLSSEANWKDAGETAAAAAVTQMDSAQTSEAQALPRATLPSSPPLPLIAINTKTPHHEKMPDLQLLQRGPSLSLGGLHQPIADPSSSPSMQNLPPSSLFQWTNLPQSYRLLVGHHHYQSPWCCPSPHNGSEESSRGSSSYQSQNETEELQLQNSIFAVELL